MFEVHLYPSYELYPYKAKFEDEIKFSQTVM